MYVYYLENNNFLVKSVLITIYLGYLNFKLVFFVLWLTPK